MRVIGNKEVRTKLGGVSPATFWRMRQDPSFPRAVQFPAGGKGWVESEVEDWINGLSREVPNAAAKA